MMIEKRRYGIGQQYFPDVIGRECVYVDKTEYVWKMAQSGGKNFFLSRPRRFGKSLLVSTLEAYFQGRRDLFEGLAVSRLEKEWTPYPVIRIDLSSEKYYELEQVHAGVNLILKMYEEQWGVAVDDPYRYGVRLANIIQAAYRQTGRQVVVLIDEYDAPMLDSIHKPELQDQIRERIRSLFSPLKSQAQYLRMVFLTGISKFSQLSVFSELNNLKVMTYDPEYEGICGITEEELMTQLRLDIEWLTEARRRWFPETTFDDTVRELKRMYDGYHFTKKMTDIYNPWSLIYAFDQGEIAPYWFSTGTPTMLVNLMRQRRMRIPDLEHLTVSLDKFDAPTERIEDPIPVLYQSGYLTLKAYDPRRDRYTLGFPNAEVYEGFSRSLYRYYCADYSGSDDLVGNAYLDFKFGDIAFDGFMHVVQQWYKGIPYSITDRNQNEQLYQSLLYALLAGLGADVQAESQTSDGRMDIALKMHDAIYILEFKYDKSAEEAIEQIQRKDYASLFAADPRPVYAVGLNIDSERRTISSYDIERLK